MMYRVYKIGQGPSSSHSMGPRRAAELFGARIAGRAQRVEVTLYGSLAATGKGHLTDHAIADGLRGVAVKIHWRVDVELPLHPNGMAFEAYGAAGELVDSWRVYSIGGGDLLDEGGPVGLPGTAAPPQKSLQEVLAWCQESGLPVWAFGRQQAGDDSWEPLREVWGSMTAAISEGLSSKEEYLPGSLRLRRRAAEMLGRANDAVGFRRDLNLLAAYALAVAEHNAAGGRIVTAPTCGSSGVLPSVLYYFYKHRDVGEQAILEALATAAILGSVVVARASISGAQVGCQGEIGVACAMAAGAAAQIMRGTPAHVEYAAEMGLEHCLGLTCDPVAGLVQVPCIERNAFAAMRAVDCATYAMATDGQHLVSFDDVVDVMNATGRDLQAKYRETATGGLAQIMAAKFKRMENGGQG